jgi:phage/plasmid-associated DNA primase
LARFIGKTLLSGKDVAGNFLQSRGASGLKKLVGHDLLSAELKKANGGIPLRGDFNVVCTCNTRLCVRLDGDVDAWRRRLILIEYSRPKPDKPVRDFADGLLNEEASGIVYWMLQGAVRHLSELKETGDYQLTERQRQRTENLLNESDSVRHFLQDRVARDQESDVSSEELIRGYFDYCAEKAWRAFSRREVESALPDLMLQIHRVSRSHDIQRDGKACRGYNGVLLCPSNNPF